MKTQLVGKFQSHRLGFTIAVFKIPAHLLEMVAAGIIKAKAFPAAPGRIFPLGFCGQAKVLGCHELQFFNKFLGIIPADALHRTIVSLILRRVFPHHRLPDPLGNRIPAQVKGAEPYLVDGPFIILLTAHGKKAAVNMDHLNGQAAADRYG